MKRCWFYDRDLRVVIHVYCSQLDIDISRFWKSFDIAYITTCNSELPRAACVVDTVCFYHNHRNHSGEILVLFKA